MQRVRQGSYLLPPYPHTVRAMQLMQAIIVFSFFFFLFSFFFFPQSLHDRVGKAGKDWVPGCISKVCRKVTLAIQ